MNSSKLIGLSKKKGAMIIVKGWWNDDTPEEWSLL